MTVAVLIAAAGMSRRMGSEGKKELLSCGGRLVLERSLESFAATRLFSVGVVVSAPSSRAPVERALFAWQGFPLIHVPGGASRQESVRLGLLALAGEDVSLVHIHDGARPWVSPALIRRTHQGALVHGACLPVVPSVNALKQVEKDVVVSHLSRESVYEAQTPQVFRFREILDAHKRAKESSECYIDDASLWAHYRPPTHVIEGDPRNRKITFPHDIGDL